MVLGHVDRKGQYTRSVWHGGLDPRGKRAALRVPTGTGSADNAVLDVPYAGMYLTLDHHLDHVASLREHCSRDLGIATSIGAGPRQRDDHALVGVIDPGASDTTSTWLCTELAPAGLALRVCGGVLNGESEDGGRLELWLSLAQRASNSRMYSRSGSMSTVCSATCSHNRFSLSSGFSREWGRVVYFSIVLGYVCSLPLGKKSGIVTPQESADHDSSAAPLPTAPTRRIKTAAV